MFTKLKGKTYPRKPNCCSVRIRHGRLVRVIIFTLVFHLAEGMDFKLMEDSPSTAVRYLAIFPVRRPQVSRLSGVWDFSCC